LYISTEGAGPITSVRVNQKPWKAFDARSVFLAYDRTPDEAHIVICMGGASPGRQHRRPAPALSVAPPPGDRFWDISGFARITTGNVRPLRIGADSNGSNRFLGDMRRARIFRRALKPEEVMALAQDPLATLKDDPSLVVDCLFDQKTDGAFANLAAKDLPARIVGQVGVVEAPGGKAIRFTGEGYLEVGLDPRLALRDAYTLDAWICPQKLPDTGGRIIDKVTAGADDGYLLDMHPGNSLRFITEQGNIGFDARLTPDAWAHVAAIFDSKDGLRLYLNGRLVASGPVTESPAGSPIIFEKVGTFYNRLCQAGLGDCYEARHARLVVEYVAAIHARAKLKAAGKLPALSPASQMAADKSYIDAVNRLAEGLIAVLKSCEKSEDPHKKRVSAIWQGRIDSPPEKQDTLPPLPHDRGKG